MTSDTIVLFLILGFLLGCVWRSIHEHIQNKGIIKISIGIGILLLTLFSLSKGIATEGLERTNWLLLSMALNMVALWEDINHDKGKNNE